MASGVGRCCVYFCIANHKLNLLSLCEMAQGAAAAKADYAAYDLNRVYSMGHELNWGVLLKRGSNGHYIGVVIHKPTKKDYFQKTKSFQALFKDAAALENEATYAQIKMLALDFFQWCTRKNAALTEEEELKRQAIKQAGGDPEPPKGKKGETQRFLWQTWKDRQKSKAAEAAKALYPPRPPPSPPSPAPAAPAPKTKAKAKAKAAAAPPAAKPRRLPVNAKRAAPTVAAAGTPTPVAGKKRKAVEIEEPVLQPKAAQEEVEVGAAAVQEQEEGDEDADFTMATRAPGKNARGQNRRVGKGKKCSASETDAAANPVPRKKGLAAVDSNTMELADKSRGLAILPGAETLFRAQRLGSKGLRVASKKHSQRSSIMPSKVELDAFEASLDLLDPLASDRDQLLRGYMKGAHAWLWQLQLNFSVLLFGVGCKAKLLQAFCKDYLVGEDVLMLDGRADGSAGGGSRAVKALLHTISDAVLKQPHLGSACLTLDNYAQVVKAGLQRNYNRLRAVDAQSIFAATSEDLAPALAKQKGGAPPHAAAAESKSEPSEESLTEDYLLRAARAKASGNLDGGAADPSWGGRFAHAKAKLYIVVQNIDAESLQSSESQRVLAALAECPSVSLIATCDKVNTPLLWSSGMLAKFRWHFQHVPTFESRPVPSGFALLAGRKGVASQDHALEYILGSLTGRHKEMLELLARERQEELQATNRLDSEGKGGGGAFKGTSLDDLYDLAKKAGLVSQSTMFQSYLKELEDHRLVRITTNATKKKFVHISNDKLERQLAARL